MKKQQDQSSEGTFVPCNQSEQQTTWRVPHDEKLGIFLLGVACSGKGEVARRLKSLSALHFSSSLALGGYARRLHYPEILEQMKKGELVDFEHVRLVSGWHYQDHLAHRKFSVFDGWLRVHQEILEEDMQGKMRAMSQQGHVKVVCLKAHPETIFRRARDRGRGDDVAIRTRLHLHDQYHPGVCQAVANVFGTDAIQVIETDELDPEGVSSEVFTCLGFKNDLVV